jgi:ABC-2 type transport system ATP-binding protein
MAVVVKNLFKIFGDLIAVNNVSFSMKKGEIHGFVGPNGAGKTTTMRIMSTLDLPSSGDVSICGVSVIENPLNACRMIGFVPDWFRGHKDMIVHEYLDLFARMYGLKGKIKEKTVSEIEDFTSLTPLKDKLVSELSRGMQQRVCLGRALINDPDIFIMDEPAANLDPRARVEFRELVKELAKRNKGILISSHILRELSEICDSITIIDEGSIIKTGSMDEINSEVVRGTRSIQIGFVNGTLKSKKSDINKFLLEHPGIEDVELNENSVRIQFKGEDSDIAELLKKIVNSGFPVMRFHTIDEDLEDIFMKLTAEGGK